MKKNIFFLTILWSMMFYHTNAQINENPINELAEKLAQNDMLTKRFFRNYLFVKSNIFTDKTIKDTDRAIALFDENLSALSLFLPDSKKVEENYLKLHNYWNIYRLKVTDYEKKNYLGLANSTHKFVKLNEDFQSSLIKLHPQYSSYKKTLGKINRITENENLIENIAINYLLKRGLNQPSAAQHYGVDLGSIKSNLKKLGKDKNLDPELKALVTDMVEITKNIDALLSRDSYHPKLMYSYVKNISNKSFQFIKIITSK
jgi:hypothetical protein